ncbi:MAG: alpha-L-rhamnosidase C-terminal domain-containing protein, partial [Eubacteriales bacterium]|nr:alpha-L-rhamnosidase C-terminal domain-containing protein [Eubacteriales bacterium]
PVCDGVLFEVPYRVYMASGDSEIMTKNLPYFKKYLRYISGKADHEDGMVGYGLYDWASPETKRPNIPAVPVKFINTVLIIKFHRIAVLAAELGGLKEEAAELGKEAARLEALFRSKFITGDGTSAIGEQTAVAMIIYHRLYDCLGNEPGKGLEPLKAQLKRLVEERDFHHNCGMVGLRHLYDALSICGLDEYAYRIITARGYPSYSLWLEGGATTLWETWQPGHSKNHHMYSDFMAWLMKKLVGINPVAEAPGYEKAVIDPVFVPGLDWCRGFCDTVRGRISVEWERTGLSGGAAGTAAESSFTIRINIPEGVRATFKGRRLKTGKNEFSL